MANPAGNWKPGQSGNPKGRPPKGRALTEVLERAGSKGVEVDGKRVAGKRIVAQLLWEAATTGFVTFPPVAGEIQKPRVLGTSEWYDIVKFLYTQIDGAPKQSMDLDVTSGGERVELDDAERIARVAAILDAARARRAGQPDSGADPEV